MEGRPLLQALAARKIKDYHEATHFTMGSGLGPEPKVASTQHQTDFPVRWGDIRWQAAPQPQSSDVLSKEEGLPYQPETETMEKFQGKPLARRPPIYPTPVGGMIPVDSNEQRPLTLSQDTYRWHKNIHQPEKISPDKRKTKIILDNDEPMRPTISCQQDSYRDPDKVLKGSLPQRDETGHSEYRGKLPAKSRLPSLPRESESSNERWAYRPMPPKSPCPDFLDMKHKRHRAKAGLGNREERLETARATAFPWGNYGGEKGQSENLGKFLADSRLPALPHPESESSTGEPPQTPKQALKPTPPKGPRPDPKKRWRRANAPVDERKEKLESTMAADFQWRTCEPRKSSKCPDVMLSVINGDPEAGKEVDRKMTYSHFYGKPTNKDMRSDPQKEEPLCVTIPGQPLSSSTAYKEHFQWAPAGYRKPDPIKLEMQKTHFELKLSGTGPMTSITQDFYAGRKLESGKKMRRT